MLNLRFAGLRKYNGKSVIVKNWNIVGGKNHGTDTLVVGDD